MEKRKPGYSRKDFVERLYVGMTPREFFSVTTEFRWPPPKHYSIGRVCDTSMGDDSLIVRCFNSELLAYSRVDSGQTKWMIVEYRRPHTKKDSTSGYALRKICFPEDTVTLFNMSDLFRECTFDSIEKDVDRAKE